MARKISGPVKEAHYPAPEKIEKQKRKQEKAKDEPIAFRFEEARKVRDEYKEYAEKHGLRLGDLVRYVLLDAMKKLKSGEMQIPLYTRTTGLTPFPDEHGKE